MKKTPLLHTPNIPHIHANRSRLDRCYNSSANMLPRRESFVMTEIVYSMSDMMINHFLKSANNLTHSAFCCPTAFLSIYNLLEKHKRLLWLHFLWNISSYFANDFGSCWGCFFLLLNPNIKECHAFVVQEN